MSVEQKALMDYMSPGKIHDMIAKHAGEWETISTLSIKAESEPLVSKRKDVNDMIMGGCYILSKHSGTALDMSLEDMNN